MNSQTQEEKYDKWYETKEYTDYIVADSKITNGKEVKNKKILLLGAGTARDVRFLIDSNEVYAIDISKISVDFLRKLGIKSFKGDLNMTLEFKDNCFDLIIAKDILEHLDSPLTLSKEISRVLKPSGYAVIDVPNHFFLPMRLKMLFGGNIIWKTIDHDHTKEFQEWNYMHKIFFTWKGFQRFLNESGLKVVKTFWDFGTLNHYSQPEMVISYMKQKGSSNILTKILEISWNIFNFIFPKSLRSFLVSTSPSLLCASFYVWAKPLKK
jgi:SAM-dependent methyltransferase